MTDIVWAICIEAQAWYLAAAERAADLSATVTKIRECSYHVAFFNVDAYHEGRPEDEGRFPYMAELETPRGDELGRYALPDYLSGGSDYDNMGLVGIANLESWREAFDDSCGEWWDAISVGFGGEQVIIDMHHPDLPEEAAEILGRLESYCMIDEEKHSELESKAIDDQWAEHGEADLRRELISIAPDDLETLFDEFPDDGLRELFWKFVEDTSTYPWIEGSSAIYDTDKAAPWILEHLGIDNGHDIDGQTLYNASPYKSLPWCAVGADIRLKYEAMSKELAA